MGIEIQDAYSIISLIKKEDFCSKESLLILGNAKIYFDLKSLRRVSKKLNYEFNFFPKELNILTFGKFLGFKKVETLDLNGKANLIIDLQENLSKKMFSRYDFIIDAGVLFWCFNPGDVLKNIYRMAKKDALIFHITGLTGYFGRGYYNIHPKLFHDFYLETNNCLFLQEAYRTKLGFSKIKYILYRILEVFGIKNLYTINTFYASSSKNNFLNKTKNRKIIFGKELKKIESKYIPNNSILTFACKKIYNKEPFGPIQLES